MKIDIRPTKTTEGRAFSIAKLGKELVNAIFLSKRVLKVSGKWRKHRLTVEFLSRNLDGSDELQISNLTISESGIAGTQLPDSKDGVDLIRFIKILKKL